MPNPLIHDWLIRLSIAVCSCSGLLSCTGDPGSFLSGSDPARTGQEAGPDGGVGGDVRDMPSGADVDFDELSDEEKGEYCQRFDNREECMDSDCNVFAWVRVRDEDTCEVIDTNPYCAWSPRPSPSFGCTSLYYTRKRGDGKIEQFRACARPLPETDWSWCSSSYEKRCPCDYEARHGGD